MVADIASGNTSLADVLFLAAFIACLVAIVCEFPRPGGAASLWRLAIAAALACATLAWLVL